MACEVLRPAMISCYAIAGRFLCLESFGQEPAALTSNFLRDFNLEPVAPGSDPSFRIRFHSNPAVAEIPQALEAFDVAFGKCYLDGSYYYLQVDDSLIVIGPPSERTIDVWTGKSAYERDSLSFSNLMSYVLDASLRRCGLYQLHGSGVVDPQGDRCALILGESGSGKSTLATMLLSRGWLYLTDDALLLSEDQASVQARGMRKFFAASEKTLKACGLAAADKALGGPIRSDPTKRRLEPHIAFPGKLKTLGVPSVVLFSSIIDSDRSLVKSLSQRQSMLHLIKFNPWASYDRVTARDHLRLLNQLAKQCRSYSIESGRDILSDPSRADQLISSLM